MKELEAAVRLLAEATADEERIRSIVVQAHTALATANAALQGAMAEVRAYNATPAVAS